MTKTVKLTKHINDGKITEVTLREPTFGDLQRHGLPMDKDGLDFKKAGPLLEACSGVQEPMLREMSAKDSLEVISALSEYLADDVGNSD